MNRHGEPFRIEEVATAVASGIYANDVLFHIDATLLGLLRTTHVLEAYRLDATAELLRRAAIFPRVNGAADLRDSMDSEGRKVVNTAPARA